MGFEQSIGSERGYRAAVNTLAAPAMRLVLARLFGRRDTFFDGRYHVTTTTLRGVEYLLKSED